MGQNAMSDLQRHIREVTVEMGDEDYLEFMKELGLWVEDEIARTEYTIDEAFSLHRE